MKEEAAKQIFSIVLKVRILRAWQQANQTREQMFSERELLTMELINDYPPITEKALTKMFGISFSSVSDMVSRLEELKIIDSQDKARGKPLALTKHGKERLDNLKAISSKRYDYLFDSLTDQEWAILLKIYKKMDDNVERVIQNQVLGDQQVE